MNDRTAMAVGQRRRFSSAALLLTIPVGLLWRLLPTHLPPFAFKYGGSALWAIAVYWMAAVLLPRRRPLTLGALAAVVALGVELLKRVYWAPLDRFRETLAGKLLLGRYFSYGAIVAYWLAIAAVLWLDSTVRLPGTAAAPVSDGMVRGVRDGLPEDVSNTLAEAETRD